ncbi:extracellular cell wall glucanase Crf1/allergen Asp F9 [Trichodelitschia bisporula]|uniref:Crh-like protein n=1 Tax=Trichodelitschia bisporula TaxID=703511 RepID=A0A6G1HZC2_9PEZI|nr:extracellular cell wall glucanase Crf1/allergen Asp F9 [Trichodelitschia bisporula]
MHFLTATSLLAIVPAVLSQTFTSCDPLKRSDCPANPGLPAEYSVDFRNGAPPSGEWTIDGPVTYGPDGAELTISKLGDGPTIATTGFYFFGYAEVVFKAAPGAGIVSSMVIQSDDRDEIDWEVVGSKTNEVQSNYFGKGNDTTFDRGATHPLANVDTQFHTYAVSWTKESITWMLDGAPVRTVNYAEAVGGANFPQTPSNLRIGSWVPGTPGNAQGTIDWAGGLADFSKAPFVFTVQSVKVVNSNPGDSYTYGDNTGSMDSIKVLGGSNSVSSGDSAATTASGNNLNLASKTESGSKTTCTKSSHSVKAQGGGFGESSAAGQKTYSISVASGKPSSGDSGSGSDNSGSDNSGNGGIVAVGQPSNTPAPTFTIKPGSGNGSGQGKTAAAGATGVAGATGSMATSFGLGATASRSGSAAPAVFTGAAVRRTDVNIIAAALIAAVAIVQVV